MTTPAIPTPDQQDTTDPFVRVLRDKDTGRVVIALDQAAADALDSLLDSLDLSDMAQNPGVHGLSNNDAAQQAGVASDIRAQLGKLLRGF